jgi:hypothetical protein
MTPETTAMLEAVAAAAILDPEVVHRQISEPQFEQAGRVHDWRNYVPESVQARWGELCSLGKLAVYACAEQAASREDWD